MRLSWRSRRTYTVGILVAALSVSTAWAGDKRSAATGPDAVRIENFGKINDHYYRGAQPKGDDFRALAAIGVKTVIDLAAEGDPAEEAHAKAAGMRFVRIPMTVHIAPTPSQITQFLALANDPASQPVYVHCIGGRHRTGVMTAIYRMTMDQWNAARALAEMKAYRYGAEFLHPEFKAFIETYIVPMTSGGTTGKQ